MLEVLIAIVIFSFGLLGLLGLQLVGLAGIHSATLRSIAVAKAYDLSDRMRANLAGVNAGAYNNAGAGTDNACRAVHFMDTHATPAVCTPAQLAQDDLKDWNQALSNLLPGGVGVVCIDSTPDDSSCDGIGSSYAIKVWWNDKPKNQVAVTKRVSMEFHP